MPVENFDAACAAHKREPRAQIWPMMFRPLGCRTIKANVIRDLQRMKFDTEQRELNPSVFYDSDGFCGEVGKTWKQTRQTSNRSLTLQLIGQDSLALAISAFFFETVN